MFHLFHNKSMKHTYVSLKQKNSYLERYKNKSKNILFICNNKL
jgi:hypothetical protein